jgi:hypothetical protein
MFQATKRNFLNKLQVAIYPRWLISKYKNKKVFLSMTKLKEVYMPGKKGRSLLICAKTDV